MTIGVAVVGLGFMGRTHLGAYRAAGDACRLAAVFDADPARLSGEAMGGGNIGGDGSPERLFDPAEVFATDSLDALLARGDVDAVSICTPTDTHVEIARAALRAGKHVLVEKPVSLDRGEIESLAEEAERAGRVCMPAMCMRFWPEWAWLADAVREGLHCGVRSLAFERLGSAPDWGGGFYADPARCGGALHDLHIHDTDFVVHLLGRPEAVTSVGDRDRLTTTYHYDTGPAHVVAAGGWLRGGAAFRMRYTAEFEDATADFDLGRDPTLVLSRTGDARGVDVEQATGYDLEVRAFLSATAGRDAPAVTLEDAVTTLAVLEAESRSLESGRREPTL